MLMNMCALVWSFLLFLLGVVQLVQDFIGGSLGSEVNYMNFIKMGMFLNFNAIGFVGSHFLS
jgi:hypothetical protein